MSFTLPISHGAGEDLSKAEISNSNVQGLHRKIPKFGRFLPNFGMSTSGDDSEAVKLKGSHSISPNETDRLGINGETNSNSERILGPTGTVRGLKNIVKSRKENLRKTADGGEMNECEEDEVGKIIIYTTSFGGVRSKETECRLVINIFDSLGLKYDVRDIFMNKEYQQELDARVGLSGVEVPQVFVNGLYMGGVSELEHLNETEQLKTLLSDFEKRNGHVCQTCGGFRYVNCPNCNGSKKARTTRISREISLLRCTACNENGLLRCPDCS